MKKFLYILMVLFLAVSCFAGPWPIKDGVLIAPGSDTDADIVTVSVTGTPLIKWDESEDAFSFSKGITLLNGLTIGQSAGPLLTFDDTNNFLGITGCKVGIETLTPDSALQLAGVGYTITDGITFSEPTGGVEISGIYQYDNLGNLAVQVDGSARWRFTGGLLGGFNVNGAGMGNKSSSTTIPGLFPNQSDTDTGLGWDGADNLVFITGGVEGARIDEFGAASLKGLSLNVVAKTAAYTATVIDDVITCGAGDESFTIDLPAGSTGKIYTVTNVGTGVINVDADTTGSTTINGNTDVDLFLDDSIMIIYNGTEYRIL